MSRGHHRRAGARDRRTHRAATAGPFTRAARVPRVQSHGRPPHRVLSGRPHRPHPEGRAGAAAHRRARRGAAQLAAVLRLDFIR